MPCTPVIIPTPAFSSSPAIPGFGQSFILPVQGPIFPSGFPEDLLDIFNNLQMLIPPGVLQPTLNPNFGKDIYDGMIKLLDQFMPFLMLYKFFLPVLNLIICIIEVLCALMNPFALVAALEKLFLQCIPQFLNLFPQLAMIMMIISLLILLIELILFIIAQIEKFVLGLIRNINALIIAFQTANSTSVANIATKLASLLCTFQNFLVLLAFFEVIIQIFKDILQLVFAIPPCEGSSSSGCCSPTTCPAFVQNPYTNTNGFVQYLPEAGFQTGLPVINGFFNIDLRSESWQIFDPNQNIAQAFWNIVDGYDISPTVNPKPVFFPTDASYSATTPAQQAAYTIDLRLFYNPAQWGRPGIAQYIRFSNCIVLAAPTQFIKDYNNGQVSLPTGVLFLAGGLGYLDDGVTQITGYAADGTTPISAQATLNNFIHTAAEFSLFPSLSPTDGYTFSGVEYTFKPNLPVLLAKNLVTLGCEPSIMLSRAFVNNVMFSQVSLQSTALKNLVNSPDFPSPGAAQQCLQTAISNLQTNMSLDGVAQFQSMTTACLSVLQTNTQNAIGNMVGIGFNPCDSNFTLTPSVQFTTRPILVSVSLNETNGLPLTNGIPTSVAANLAQQIKPYATFGEVSNFAYDGYQAFTAEITSKTAGAGNIMISFQDQILCTNTVPTDGSAPTHTLQTLPYEFIYSSIPVTGENDTLGQPRRDAGDLSRDNNSGGGD